MEQNNRVKQLEEINKNALQALKDSGVAVQTSPFPLAISTADGLLRTGSKSTFREILQKQTQFCECFTTLTPNNLTDACIIFDFMCYIHMPPPSNVNTYSEYFNYLWMLSVSKHLQQAVFVIDKPKYLPAPRDLIHDSRAKGKQIITENQHIHDHVTIPNNKAYTSLLTLPDFKERLIQYLTNKLILRCTECIQTSTTTFVIDSPSLSSVVQIEKGNMAVREPNEHGEGDVAIWHHCCSSSSQKFIIVSSDTDVWVYGLLIVEFDHHLQSKEIHVECLNSTPKTHVNVTRLYKCITVHQQLGKLSYPCASLVALYVATGSDYWSFFYRMTKQNF